MCSLKKQFKLSEIGADHITPSLIKVERDNKWKTIIQNASLNKISKYIYDFIVINL